MVILKFTILIIPAVLLSAVSEVSRDMVCVTKLAKAVLNDSMPQNSSYVAPTLATSNAQLCSKSVGSCF